MGHFIPEGVALLKTTRATRVTPELETEILAAIDIGPTRTLQQDVEFGIVQIVDIALRAISPAINDPTTAISCVDQLSRILICWLSRSPPSSYYYDPPYVLRVIVPWTGLEGLLDLAFEQIRHYAAADAAVSLRLMRALTDIASTNSHAHICGLLLERGKRIVTGCSPYLPEDAMERLRRRLSLLENQAALAIWC